MILLLVACTTESGFSSTEKIDKFSQNPSEEVDILMVVDNSNSMAPYQAKLAVNFDSFVEYFYKANVDYRLGLTTTDNDRPDAGALVGPVITPETPDADVVWADMVNVGTGGSGHEMGLATAEKGLANPDFLRQEASLSILMVSDEDDSSPDTVDQYVQAYYWAKQGLSADNLNVSALVVTDESICTPDQASQSTPSARNPQAALETGGIIGNLCETGERFSSIITDFSLAASRLQSRFYLSRDPDPSTLEVTITPSGGEGEMIPCSAGDWSYAMVDIGDGTQSPAVQFQLDRLPPADSEIRIKYNTGSGAGADYCD
jgi:hypothetical protein